MLESPLFIGVCEGEVKPPNQYLPFKSFNRYHNTPLYTTFLLLYYILLIVI